MAVSKNVWRREREVSSALQCTREIGASTLVISRLTVLMRSPSFLYSGPIALSPSTRYIPPA